ncbi:MAG: hypothetical protein JXJ17_03910 [Anaerolineae bacterium]|nr:hypothetical protein [Anaerolineae bacterium]
MAKRSSRKRNSRRPPQVQVQKEPVDLAQEYRYVIDDLKRIGIIAVILIGLLAALSFFL